MSLVYTVSPKLTTPAADSAWRFYHATFRPLAKLAVNRHLLRRDEFDEIAIDGAIEKHVATDHTGRTVGLGVITNQLECWPLVSPEFFAERHPHEYALDKIWYVGFVGARSGDLNVFQNLLGSMTAGRRNTDLFYMDFCAANVRRGIVDLCLRRLAEIDGRVTMTQVDSQSFWLATFGAEG